MSVPDGHWTAFAACGSAAGVERVEPDDLFVEGKAQRDARSVCQQCVVRLECLADALDCRANFGVWGGMTERERRALLRRRPDVESWKDELLALDDVRDAARLG
ncbi:WhiB family transcriptional regulator [Cellulomonas sp. RIT-PI-Y]|jgi:WhiB family transcriptional regulator, redox-sensing transcriptional regulator|uniref:WhiB family transcriptional regulator n=1 Tax=Cellulomonas sp. RIT-PI-Y TaxID=3035297 RepID=UPI0021D7F8B3|nr:WhiB family transcriptional regulator [Cellulomonas sp. RIT-PI-Y]